MRSIDSAIRPLTGSWISFFHQDARNDLTNPAPTAEISWRHIVHSLADLGIDKLIVMAVANEGRSAYPSEFMEPAYDELSPLDELMETAAARGAGVYLSTGWTVNQDDDPSTPETTEGQHRILNELADLYSDHAAFEGWYLPCEDSIAPKLTDRSIDSVNRVAAVARARTPRAKILISPYEPHNAEIDFLFVEQLKKIDVDAIAYQDGVGCAYTTTIAAQYPRLRWAHDQVPGIELWANVETFTWARGDANTRSDTLVPAASPRVHQQLVDATPYVDRTVCFIAQGLMQTFPSPPSAGANPVTQLRRDYEDAINGAGRWAAVRDLPAIALANRRPGLLAKVEPRPRPGMPAEYRLTDGRLASSNDPLDPAWVHLAGDARIEMDLEPKNGLAQVVVSFLHAPLLGIAQPSEIRVEVSTDGTQWSEAGNWHSHTWPYDALDRWRDIAQIGLKRSAPRLRLIFRGSDTRLLIDQLIILERDDE